MAELSTSKIVNRFMPTLLHLANVKIAVIIINKFDGDKLKQFFDRTPNIRVKKEFWKEASKVLDLVPEDLKDGVEKACFGLREAVRNWHIGNQSEFGLKNKDWVYYWRSNGMINVDKSVESLLLNVNIDIVKRFNLACQYCMEENIMNLWSEMEISGKTKCLDLKSHSISTFWACWIRDGCQVPWRQSFPVFVRKRWGLPSIARFSAYLPLLPLEERMEFLESLKKTDDDDYLHYLYAATKEEEDQILKQYPHTIKFLVAYSNWPFQGLLIETADKMWSYISENDVGKFIHWFFIKKEFCRDFDYRQLFLQSWDKIPVSFRKKVKKDPLYSKNILVYLGFVIKARNKQGNTEANKKTVGKIGLLRFTRWKFRTSKGLLRKKMEQKHDSN